MKLKKLLALAMVGVMSLGLVACGDKKEEGTDGGKKEETKTEIKDLVFHIIHIGMEHWIICQM